MFFANLKRTACFAAIILVVLVMSAGASEFSANLDIEVQQFVLGEPLIIKGIVENSCEALPSTVILSFLFHQKREAKKSFVKVVRSLQPYEIWAKDVVKDFVVPNE